MPITFTAALLVFLLIPYAWISIYALIYLILALRFLFKGLSPLSNGEDEAVDGLPAVAVLIPAHNEGSGLVDAAETLLKQDYKGEIHSYLLIENPQDSAIPFLRQRFQIQSESEQRIDFQVDVSRKLSVLFCRVRAKRERLNYFLDSKDFATEFVAFLDADHRAEPTWIRLSINELKVSESCAVQSRRGPFSTKGFFESWDSIENHIGNEVLNNALTSFSYPVFFTGTTAVFRSTVFKNGLRFEDSLTEDTALSYKIFALGERVSYCSALGSREELAPNLSSFISRRRRWARGHTVAFLRNLTGVLRSNAGVIEKVFFVLHGLFFALSAAIVSLLVAAFLFMFLQLQIELQALVLTISVALATTLVFITRSIAQNYSFESLVALLWCFPHACLFVLMALPLIEPDAVYGLVSLPVHNLVGLMLPFLWIMPIVLALCGRLRLKDPYFSNPFFIVLTYPFVLPFSIYAQFLGICDCLRPSATWVHTKRSASGVDTVQPSLQWTKVVFRPRVLLISVSLLIILALFRNDFIRRASCGQDYWLYPFNVFLSLPLEAELSIADKQLRDDEVAVQLRLEVSPEQEINAQMLLNEQVIDAEPKSPGVYLTDLVQKLGWATSIVKAKIEKDNFHCELDLAFDPSVKSLRDSKLLLNNEPFLIKGIVPSFFEAQHSLGLDEGMSLISSSGANVLRLYHAPTDDYMDLLEKHKLMLIAQPERSTWNELRVDRKSSRMNFYTRTRDLIEKTQGFSRLLFHNFGNELEIRYLLDGGDEEVLKGLDKMLDYGSEHLNPLLQAAGQLPLAYSTYRLDPSYKTEILGYNGLDTGPLPWQKNIPGVAEKFEYSYLSEFGGFQAPFESPSPYLRGLRMQRQWQQVLDLKMLGAVFFQSHDNWAQPVVEGINDPFSPDHPDDLRGVWTKDGVAKHELKVLREIYSDLELEEVLKLSEDRILVRLKNRRPYRLEKIHRSGGSGSVEPSSIEASTSAEFELVLQDDNHQLRLDYETHSGVSASSWLTLPRVVDGGVTVLNWDFEGKDRVLGRAQQNEFDVVIPYSQQLLLWSDKIRKIVVDSREHNLRQGLNNVPIGGAVYQAQSLEMLVNRKFRPFRAGVELPARPYLLRFRMPEELLGRESELVLSGLATWRFQLRKPGEEEFQKFVRRDFSQYYQEYVIDIAADQRQGPGTYYYLMFNAETNASPHAESVPFLAPYFYAPHQVQIRLVD